MKQENHPEMGFYTIGVAIILLAVFFLLVLSGTGAYRGTVEGQEKNNHDRALLAYVSACVRSGDAQGAVRVSYVDGAPVLSVEDGDSGYGMRIYQYEGKLLGEYGGMDAELDPAEALAVGETETFQVGALGNDIYEVTTDAGRVLFYVRSGGD